MVGGGEGVGRSSIDLLITRAKREHTAKALAGGMSAEVGSKSACGFMRETQQLSA